MPEDGAIELHFTYSSCFHVYDAEYVASHPEPNAGCYPGLNAPDEEKQDFMERRAARQEWEQAGGCLTFFCPAVHEQRYDRTRDQWFNGDVFLDLSHVHRGDYNQPVADFTFERYPRTDKQPYVMVRRAEGNTQARVLNITKDWARFPTDDQVAVLKHTKAIGEAYVQPHCNETDRVVEMVAAVQQVVTAWQAPQ